MLVLIGVPIVVIGFALRFNALLVVTIAGVGGVVAGLVKDWVPIDSPFAVVAAYTVGMALFTMIMGNGFAAFPVMTAGIGLPLIVHQFHGNPAILGAIGMLSGF